MRAALTFALFFQLADAQAPAAVNCAGADLSGLKTITYVSPDGADSDSCGQSAASACKTIQQGINNCKGDNCGVVVRYGVYSPAASVQLVNGVSVYGSCTFDGVDRKYRSTVFGRPAISANNINSPTILYGFVLMGTDASAGQASIAMAVSNSTGLTLSNNVLASGRGGNGSPGAYADGGPGADGFSAIGVTGGRGGAACRASRLQPQDALQHATAPTTTIQTAKANKVRAAVMSPLEQVEEEVKLAAIAATSLATVATAQRLAPEIQRLAARL